MRKMGGRKKKDKTEKWRGVGWGGKRSVGTEEGRTSYIDMDAFQIFIICKRTNDANKVTHYVKLGK